MNEPEVLRRMLAARTIAVLGLSANPAKPSHFVAAFLQAVGKQIFPVNPSLEHVLGERAYPSLAALPERPEVVNVFRLPSAIPAIVEDMIRLDLRQLWVQTGIVNEHAARHAEANGIAVVMDRCMMVEYQRGRV